MGWFWTSEQTLLLRAIDARVTILLRKVGELMAALDELRREVEETQGVVDSAIVLLGDLSQYIRDNVGNQAALLELAADLDSKQVELADAIAANQPPTPEPPPDDEEESGI